MIKGLPRYFLYSKLAKKNGVDIHDFFNHFKGNFRGKAFDSDLPPKQYLANSVICKQFVDFISAELCNRISTGSIKLLGRVGECQPPRVIMPLTRIVRNIL